MVSQSGLESCVKNATEIKPHMKIRVFLRRYSTDNYADICAVYDSIQMFALGLGNLLHAWGLCVS